MVTFERSEDWELIKRIMTDPHVWPYVSDDFSPTPEQWEPVKMDVAHYIIVRDGEEILGMWLLFPENAVCWKVHTCLLPAAYGLKSRKAVKSFADWVWRNTHCMRVITDVPAGNRLALKFALEAGLEPYGLNPASFMKHGHLEDQLLLGICRPEGIPCPQP